MLLVLVLAGCADGGGDDASAPTDTAPSTTTPPAPDEGPGSTLASTTTTASTSVPASTLPEGSVAVPIDEDLVDVLPELEGGGRQVDTDEAFDERFCDGSKAPELPKSQARATYPISDTDVITVAAFRFAAGAAPDYLASYAETVRSCAIEAGDSQGLGVPELFGSAFRLTTETGEGFMALALYEDVMWVLFQESSAGPVEVDPNTLDGFIQTILS